MQDTSNENEQKMSEADATNIQPTVQERYEWLSEQMEKSKSLPCRVILPGFNYEPFTCTVIKPNLKRFKFLYANKTYENQLSVVHAIAKAKNIKLNNSIKGWKATEVFVRISNNVKKKGQWVLWEKVIPSHIRTSFRKRRGEDSDPSSPMKRTKKSKEQATKKSKTSHTDTNEECGESEDEDKITEGADTVDENDTATDEIKPKRASKSKEDVPAGKRRSKGTVVDQNNPIKRSIDYLLTCGYDSSQAVDLMEHATLRLGLIMHILNQDERTVNKIASQAEKIIERYSKKKLATDTDDRTSDHELEVAQADEKSVASHTEPQVQHDNVETK